MVEKVAINLKMVAEIIFNIINIINVMESRKYMGHNTYKYMYVC